MNSTMKRMALGFLVVLEICTIIILCVLVIRQLQKQAKAVKYAVRLPADTYFSQVKSDRFPNFYEPIAGKIINDHPDWLGYNVSYSINADALNERIDYPVIKPANTFRIMSLGDSFTYGLFVNTYENYTERLEDYLGSRCSERFEVINLGVPAYDVGYSAERFRLRGQKYMPDLVIWFMNPFTFLIDADRKMELENEYLNKIPTKDHWQVINGRQEYYPGMLAWKQQASEVPSQMRVVQQGTYFREFLASYHGALVVIAHDWSGWQASAKQTLQEALLYRENALVYEMDFLQPGNELLIDGHPNVKGHERIATNILSYLTNQGILLCRQHAP